MRRGSQVFIFRRQVTRTGNRYLNDRVVNHRRVILSTEIIKAIMHFQPNKEKTLVVKAFSEYYENITKFQLYLRMYLICGAAIAGLLLVVPQSDEVWHYGQLGRRARAATVHTSCRIAIGVEGLTPSKNLSQCK